MRNISQQAVLKVFENPDEVREFVKGRFQIVRIGAVEIGRATYQPGWRWSVHVGPTIGASRIETADSLQNRLMIATFRVYANSRNTETIDADP